MLLTFLKLLKITKFLMFPTLFKFPKNRREFSVAAARLPETDSINSSVEHSGTPITNY